MNKTLSKDLESCLDELGLGTVRREYARQSAAARAGGAGYEQFLLDLLRQECDHRRDRRIVRRLKESRLPLEKTLETFDLKRLPLKAAQQVRMLLTGEFAGRRENLLIFGNPGSGKTHLACGIAHALVRMDRAVYFTTSALLLQDLLASRRELRLKRLLKALARYEALVIDDIGYVAQEQKETEVLFTLLAERYERGSVIITSNLPFSRWENIFKDPMMTAAAVDRIVHHSVILELNIESYRISAARRKRQDVNSQENSPRDER